MTAFEMFKQKYEEWLKRMTAREWERIKECAEFKKIPIPDYMMMCIEVTINDCNPRHNAEAYWELVEMNKNKLVAGNAHRQYHGRVITYWLTKKGLREFNKTYNAE